MLPTGLEYQPCGVTLVEREELKLSDIVAPAAALSHSVKSVQ